MCLFGLSTFVNLNNKKDIDIPPKFQFVRTKCLIWWIAICHDNHSELSPSETSPPGSGNPEMWLSTNKSSIHFGGIYRDGCYRLLPFVNLKLPLRKNTTVIFDIWLEQKRAPAKSLQLKVPQGKQRNATLESGKIISCSNHLEPIETIKMSHL